MRVSQAGGTPPVACEGSTAEQPPAADAWQPPLVPHCGCQASAEAQRSVARAARGEQGVIPESGGGGRWLEGLGARGGHRRPTGCRQAPWGRDLGAEARVAASTEHRTGADGPQRTLCGRRRPVSCGPPLTAGVRLREAAKSAQRACYTDLSRLCSV
jgi:hypothetical protein